MVDDTTRTAGAASDPIVVEVRAENLAPANGSILTAASFGFHNGTFDVDDLGGTASEVLERLSEEGNPVPVMEAFAASGAGAAHGVVGGPFVASTDFGPGDSGSYRVRIEPSDPPSNTSPTVGCPAKQ